jgi:hypothetical protein
MNRFTLLLLSRLGNNYRVPNSFTLGTSSYFRYIPNCHCVRVLVMGRLRSSTTLKCDSENTTATTRQCKGRNGSSNRARLTYNCEMSTVYVLGAGASKHVGYPLSSTMGIEMLSWMSKRGDDFKFSAEFIRQEFGDLPNIENVITELDSHVDALKNAVTLEERLKHIPYTTGLRQLRTALPIWFGEIHNNRAPAYAQFAETVVESGDVVITFNYDDSLERELKRVGKWDIWQGYGFEIGTFRRPSQVPVLKLHGSMNWLVSLFGGTTSGSFAIASDSSLGHYPCIATDHLKYLGYENMTGTFPSGGGFPSLILPGRTKEFYYYTSFGPEHEEFFNSLWSQAAAALGRADKLVLCGYSLLPVDQRACELLLRGPSRDIKVVVVSGSQGERISNDFRAAGFQNVECSVGGYFETWVWQAS